ncbi:MAG: hypothetical protein ACJZ2B_03620 [Candidatus Neomarinimicrobiota bacterium]|nr:hypothetical protein [Candidatus Neomarinimicrobiota bacterium]
MGRLELTPAESYLLLDIESKDGKTLMKYSLINLLYKNVLSSEVREETEGTVFKKVVKKTYLSRGDRFDDTELKAHEKIFCSVMEDDNEIELTEFIKKIFDQYNYDDYYELMMKMQSQSGLLNIIEERVFFNIFSKKRKKLTERGEDANSKIKDILSTGKKNLPDWVLNEPARAKAYMAACGANLILLDGHDMGMLQSYESKLKDIEKQKHDDSGFIFWGDGGNRISDDMNLQDAGSMDSISNDFNSVSAFDSFDGLDAGFDGASGGDGGGGCSGCGGCGGG